RKQAEEEARKKAEEEAKRQEAERLQKEQAVLDKVNKAIAATKNAADALANAQNTANTATGQASNIATAQDAINNANTAYQQANNAINEASTALSQAEQALQDAKNANASDEVIAKAEQAVADAQNAIADAQNVRTQADNARKLAEQTQQAEKEKAEQEQAQKEQAEKDKLQQIINTANTAQNTANNALTDLNNAKALADTADTQSQKLITTEQALDNAQKALTDATAAEKIAQEALDKAKQALVDAEAVSADNEAITAAKNAVAKAEEALQVAQTIKTQAEGISEQVATTEAKAYVAPIKDDIIKQNKPDYTRTTSDKLIAAQPTPSADTLTGYAVMDDMVDGEVITNKTEAFYGLNQLDYAKKLHELKTTIDTTDLAVGIIDTGIDPNNSDMVGANLSGNNLVACSDGSLGTPCIESYDYTKFTPDHPHGSQMAAIIAGNNGMTNATIYSYSDGHDPQTLSEFAGNNDNEFIAMSRIYDQSGGKAKIFNNSWGYISESADKDEWLTYAKTLTNGTDTENSRDISVRAIHDLIINKDALLVHATGNEGENDTYGERLIPTLNPEFKRGFLAVSAPREDFAEANHCGRAAEWCVSAPSTSYSYKNSSEPEYYQGTSPATARVTGTALLVKGAYPWMKNKNLVESILSTAKDFDDIKAANPTYQSLQVVPETALDPNKETYVSEDENGNKVFLQAVDTAWLNRTIVNNIGGKNITHESGWGLLDTVAATQGYGGFYWNDVELDTTGTDVSVFSNNIKGDFGFTKAGSGKLVLTGDNTYKGDTIISGGTLEINGNNSASTVQLQNGELTGYGTSGSVVQTGGAVNNEGNLTIDGNYTMNENATFKAKFGNLLTVTNQAKVAGTLDLYDEVQQTEPLITASGSKTTVLRAKELSGEFTNAKSSNALFDIIKVEYSGTVGQDGVTTPNATQKTDVVVSAKRNELSSVGSSASQSAGRATVERNLDKVLTSLDIKDSAGTLTASEKAFATNLANVVSSVTNKTLLSTTGTPAVIDNRYNEAMFGFDPAFYANNAVHTIEQSNTQATNFAKSMADNPNGLWLNSTYQEYALELPSSDSEREVRNQSIGVAKTGERVGAGLQLDLGRLDLDERNGSTKHSVDTNAVALTLGVSTDIAQKAKGTLWAKAGVLESQAQNNTRDKHKYDGNIYAGGVHVGTTYSPSGNVKIKPYAGVSYHQYQHKSGAFDDGVSLIKDIDATRWQGTVGVDTEYQINPQWQIKAGIQYDNAFEQDAKVTSSYTGTDTNLDFDAWDTGKDKIQATIGTSYQIDSRNRISLDYEHFESEKSDGDRVQLTISSRF
ncbi:MAG: S8 family serine peptidase, partial [Moraxella sp.]|uniref:S8 family serine peptidase n=1 Tax=Moraxella sp. TaxID=479 RepID=UPI0026DB948F